MQTSHRTLNTVRRAIDGFLKRNDIYEEDAPWELRQSDLGGLGVFAKRDVQTGELIFLDNPIILGPRSGLDKPLICVNCYSKENLVKCERNCGLPVCSAECQNSSVHQKECKIIRQWKKTSEGDFQKKLLIGVSSIRSLLLGDEDKEVVRQLKGHKGVHHGFEVNVLKEFLDIKEDEEEFMRFVCRVMDSNAFEVTVGNEEKQTSVRGLYPLGSLANHSCSPNSTHVFNDQQQMVTRAAVFIPKNSEIFHSYSRLIWSTTTRRYHLNRTKHFLCKCPRCRDPTEFGSYMSSIWCTKCKGKIIARDPLEARTGWYCENCKITVDIKELAKITSLLGSVLKSFEDDDIEIMLKFLNTKLGTLVCEYHETMIELKCRIIWILGYRPGRTWSELSENLLCAKEKICRDVLELVKILNLGQCKLRGLLLYELYCCLRQIHCLREQKFSNNELDEILNEAADILMHDVNAPLEIKQKCLERT